MSDFETIAKKKKKMAEWEKTFALDLPEMEKLQQSFRQLTDMIIQQSENEIELLRALHDQDSLVKEQIKVSTLKYAQGIFEECYRRSKKKDGEQ
jgi:hypothetical protein